MRARSPSSVAHPESAIATRLAARRVRSCTLQESANFEPFYGGTIMDVLPEAVEFVDVHAVTRTVFVPAVAYV